MVNCLNVSVWLLVTIIKNIKFGAIIMVCMRAYKIGAIQSFNGIDIYELIQNIHVIKHNILFVKN